MKLGALVLAVVGAGSALAPTAMTTLTITESGYTPKRLAIIGGDWVAFSNQGTAAHAVVLRPATGFRCAADAGMSVLPNHVAASFTVRPGESRKCVFGVARRYAVTDYNNAAAAFKGTIVVDAGVPAATVSLAVKPKTVLYEGQVRLSGRLARPMRGQKIELYEFACSAGPPPKVATVETGVDGTFSFDVRPQRNTTYQAEFGSNSIAEASVKVRPRVSLRKVKPGSFHVEVLGTEYFPRDLILVQLYRPAKHRWITVKAVALRATTQTATPAGLAAISVASFRARVQPGSRVRAFLAEASGRPVLRSLFEPRDSRLISRPVGTSAERRPS